MLAACTLLPLRRRWFSSGFVEWVTCSPLSCRQVSASTSREHQLSSVLRLWCETTYPAQVHLFNGSIKQTLLSIQTEEL